MRRLVAYCLAFVALATVVAVLASQPSVPARSMGTDTYSDDALGHEALLGVMRELGVHVLVDRRGTYEFADAPVFFIEPWLRALDTDNDPIDLQHVLARRAAQGHDSVLVLPKWRRGPSRGDPVSRSYKTNVERVLAAAMPLGAVQLRREDTDVPQTAQLRQWTVPSRAGPREVVLLERQTLRVYDGRVEVLLGTRRSALIVRYTHRSGRGSIYVVSDPDLLHNFNHHRGDHAQIVLDVLDAADSDVLVIDEVFHGHAFEDTMASVLRSTPALIVVAHLLGLAILFVWAGGRPFGRPASPAGGVAASGEILSVAGQALAPPTGPATPGLVGAYITLVVTDVADRLGVSAKTSLVARAQHIDEMAQRRGVEAGAVELVGVAASLPRSRRKLLEIARQAHELRKRLLDLKGTA